MRFAVMLALALAATACGDDDCCQTGLPAVGDMPAAYKDAYCTYLARCGLFPDKATCVGASLAVVPFIDPNLVAAVGAGRVIYNPLSVKACYDAVANDTCDQTDQNGRVRVAACGQFFQGTLAGGEDCLLHQECISQRCSAGNTGTSCVRGTCVGDTPPGQEPGGLGTPCSSNQTCIDGTYCDSVTLECTALLASGAPCGSSSECDFGLACAGPTGSRVCKPLPTLGEPCPDFACRDEGQLCSTTTSICTQVGLPPAACTSSMQCSPYYRCDFTAGACVQGPGLGQPCSAGSRCFEADTYCDSATLTCVALKSDGMPCTVETQCQSGYCDLDAATPVCATQPLCT